MSETLGRDEAHLWYVRPEDAADAIDAGRGMLDAAEREQAARYRFDEDRALYTLARILVRTRLSRYAGGPPEAWTFASNAWGRPALAGPAPLPPLRFNLSHTKGLVACLVAREREVGVDAERIGRVTDILAVADRHFAPDEAAFLRSVPDEERPVRFLDLWTLKESYVKARGRGLSFSLHRFAFDLGPPLAVSFAPELQEEVGRWQHWLLRPTADHVVAATIERLGAPSVALTVREASPLLG